MLVYLSSRLSKRECKRCSLAYLISQHNTTSPRRHGKSPISPFSGLLLKLLSSSSQSGCPAKILPIRNFPSPLLQSPQTFSHIDPAAVFGGVAVSSSPFPHQTPNLAKNSADCSPNQQSKDTNHKRNKPCRMIWDEFVPPPCAINLKFYSRRSSPRSPGNPNPISLPAVWWQ